MSFGFPDIPKSYYYSKFSEIIEIYIDTCLNFCKYPYCFVVKANNWPAIVHIYDAR